MSRQSMTLSPASESVSGFAEARLGFGKVWHRRTRPTLHDFQYRAFFVAMPARMLLGPARGNWLFGVNRTAVISLSKDDHSLSSRNGLANELHRLFGAEEVTLYCFAKVLGYQFKPISFWVSPKNIVAEVRNTFGERHTYFLRRGPHLEAQKSFHVSPFCDVKGRYEFDLQCLPDRFSASINYFDTDAPTALIKTTMSGRLVPVTLASSLQAIFSFPLFSFAVIAGIHWQALRLWMKKVPWFPKPVPPPNEITHAIDSAAQNDEPGL
jgi:uncharacterized protein